MFQIDLKSRKPLYEQIVRHFKRLITTGVLKENEKVPSIREMAKSLTVTPNTIQKAYRALENQGYLYTVLGQGSFISSSQTACNANELSLLYERIKITVQELLFLGQSKQEIVKFIDNECADFRTNATTRRGNEHDKN